MNTKKLSILFLIPITLTGAIFLLYSQKPVQQANKTPTFIDNFDSLDSTVWQNGRYVYGASDENMGNGNAANASIVTDADGSYLCLQSPAPNDTGVVTSVDQFGYGTYTARMKFTASNGTWPSFWALNDSNGWEIDGIEALGNAPNWYYMTVHADSNEIGQKHYDNQNSLANQWHVYSFTWTPTGITFYLDGVNVYHLAESKSYPVSVMFTMGIMGDGIIWDGNRYDSTTWANGVPALCIDYFSFESLSAITDTPSSKVTVTPVESNNTKVGLGPAQQDKKAPTFIDNFDSLDSTVWQNGHYVYGSSDENMGNGNAANASIVTDADGSYLCLQSPAPNDTGVVTSVDQFGYGTYTARMKFTASNGTWPSFWALNDSNGWEIDGIEALGNAPNWYYMTVHADSNEIGQKHYDNQNSLANQWHVYSFTWTPTGITFYLDGVNVYHLAESKSYPVSVMFTMGIMGDGIIWDGNRYDSTTWANGVPALCIDYFSFER